MNQNGFKRRSRFVIACAVAVIGLFVSRAPAVTFIWDGGGANANWDTTFNWVGDAVPVAANDVQFGNAFTSGTTISTNGSRTANSLIINTLTGFTLSGGLGDVLTLTTGTVTRNDIAGTEANQFINDDVALGANGTWNIGGSNALQFNGVISGSGRSLTKSGAGTLIFNSGSNYSGGTFLNAGILQLNTSGAGTGAITVANGAELAIDGATVANAINLNGGGTLGTGALRIIATSNLTGAITLQSNSAVNIQAGFLTLGGVISDGANTFSLTKNGTGELRLSNANTYHGTTTVNAGLLTVSNNSALGSGGASVAAGSSLGLLSGTSINVPLTLNGATTSAGALYGDSGSTTWAGPVTLQSNSNVGVTAGTLTISGAIGQSSSSLGITKVGAGQLILSGANTYSGATSVTAGTLTVNIPAAINNSVSVGVQNGAAIEINGGVNASTALTVVGTGVSGNGALRGLSGASNWSGPITATGAFTVNAAGTMTISGAINSSGALTKIGNGSLALTNAANNFSNQDINVNAGTLQVSSEAGLPATSLINVADGANVLLTGGANVNRPLRTNGDAVFGNVGIITGNATWAGNIKFAADTGIYAGGNLTLAGNIDGIGMTLTKKGGGKLTLTGGNQFAAANVLVGTLSLGSIISGPANSVNVSDGASFELSAAGAGTGVPVHIAGDGAAGSGAFRGVDGTSSWGSSVVLDADSSVFVQAAVQLTFSSIISGPGVMTKIGPGTLILSGFSSNTTGGTIINEGTVSIADDGRLGGNGNEVTINGGKLLFTSVGTSARDYNLTNGRLQTNNTTTLSGHIRGGFLMGPGTFASNGAVFSGVTAFAGSNISVNANTLLEAFTNGGALSSSAALTWDGGVNSSSGVINLNSNTLTATAFTNDGVININNGATLLNNVNPLTSGGGSRITINAGGTLNVGTQGLQLNGALLVNNGTVTGTTNVNFGSLAKGAGIYGAVNVTDGGRFSPGNSPGTVTTGSTTWNSGGNYLVELGEGASDFWNVNGKLNVNASAQHPFTISLVSLDDLIFDNSHDDLWTILHADGGIVGLDPSQLALDISGFKSDMGSGKFWLESTSTDLVVHFSSVPEPAFAFALISVLLPAVRRRKR